MKSPRWHTCNVLQTAPDGRRLWQFAAGRNRVSLGSEEQIPVGKHPPRKRVARRWSDLVQPRLNVAWLPSRQVFLRAVQMPAVDPAELPGMIEFQLEKISPLPAQQIVWTVEAIPHADGQQLTAIVVIAARVAVEEFLGKLESEGYVAERLELPLLRELRSLPQQADELQVLIDSDLERWFCLSAWWVGGVLRELGLTPISRGTNAADVLVQHLTRTAWAGELAGWLERIPPIQLRANAEGDACFAEAVRGWSGSDVAVTGRAEPTAVAELTATHAVKSADTGSLVPQDLLARQRQLFVDRLWIRGLGTIGMAYLVIVFAYMATLTGRKMQLDGEQTRASGLARQYTNTMQLKAQLAILQDQINLKYAALDCWRSAVENLPEKLTLTSLDFSHGKTLRLAGSVAQDATELVTQFNGELQKVSARGQPLYAAVKPAQIISRPGGLSATWNFEAELKR